MTSVVNDTSAGYFKQAAGWCDNASERGIIVKESRSAS